MDYDEDGPSFRSILDDEREELAQDRADSHIRRTPVATLMAIAQWLVSTTDAGGEMPEAITKERENELRREDELRGVAAEYVPALDDLPAQELAYVWLECGDQLAGEILRERYDESEAAKRERQRQTDDQCDGITDEDVMDAARETYNEQLDVDETDAAHMPGMI